MATNVSSCFLIQLFRTTLEVSSKLYFVEICQVSEKLWLFNHKRADFWLPDSGFKRSHLSLLKNILVSVFALENCSLPLYGASFKIFLNVIIICLMS